MTKANEMEAAKIAGATAERERIKAILTAPEAAGREGAARSLALNSPMSVDAARAFLASQPKADPLQGGRAKHAPIGVVLDTDDDGPRATGALSPDEVAANVNADPEGR